MMTMTLIDRMKQLSAAEDFFTLLDLPFDVAVLGRARLHILKRMGQMLDGGALAGLTDGEARERARTLLAGAHDEFAGAAAIDKRLFKVLREHDPARPKSRAAFVPLSAIQPAGNA
jgi:hypothetical protein